MLIDITSAVSGWGNLVVAIRAMTVREELRIVLSDRTEAKKAAGARAVNTQRTGRIEARNSSTVLREIGVQVLITLDAGACRRISLERFACGTIELVSCA